MIFKPRNKSNKNCIKETAKNNKKKKTKYEKDAEDPKIFDDIEPEKVESKKVNATSVEAARESDIHCGEGNDEVELNINTVEQEDGAAEITENRPDNGSEEEQEKIAQDEAGLKEKGALENCMVQEVMEIVATVETQSKTKEIEDGGATEVEAVVTNGIKKDEEKDKDEEDMIKLKAEETADVVITTEIMAESANQSQGE